MTAHIARAHPNIALVKYWGKADADLLLPAAPSLSLTLDIFPTTTSVERVGERADTVVVDGRAASADFARRVRDFLAVVRGLAASHDGAHVETSNTVPTAAGLASSASGFAALAVAAAAAYGLDLDARALSRLARRGSGSATRSIIPGLAVWHDGDDAESFAEPVAGPALAMIVAVVSTGAKAVSSREAMRLTAQTSPYYAPWVSSAHDDVAQMTAALAEDDFTRVGELTESNALRMHAAISASRPPIRFLTPESLRVFDAVAEERRHGIEMYATADAGPNVVVLTRADDARDAEARLAARLSDVTLYTAFSGPGAHLVPRAGDDAERGRGAP